MAAVNNVAGNPVQAVAAKRELHQAFFVRQFTGLTHKNAQVVIQRIDQNRDEQLRVNGSLRVEHEVYLPDRICVR